MDRDGGYSVSLYFSDAPDAENPQGEAGACGKGCGNDRQPGRKYDGERLPGIFALYCNAADELSLRLAGPVVLDASGAVSYTHLDVYKRQYLW